MGMSMSNSCANKPQLWAPQVDADARINDNDTHTTQYTHK